MMKRECLNNLMQTTAWHKSVLKNFFGYPEQGNIAEGISILGTLAIVFKRRHTEYFSASKVRDLDFLGTSHAIQLNFTIDD